MSIAISAAETSQPGKTPADRQGQRIALYVRSVRKGRGAEQVVVTLAKGLAKKGHRVDLLLEDPDGHLLDDLPDGISLIPLKSSGSAQLREFQFRVISFVRNAFALLGSGNPRPISVASSLRRFLFKRRPPIYALSRYITERQPAAVLASLNHPCLSILLASQFCPGQTRILLCIHNNITHSVIGAKSARMKEVPILMNYLFPLADKAIAVSKGVRDDVQQLAGLPESRVMTIYNPIFQPSLLEQASTDPGHPWLAEVDRIPVILGAGKLRPQKDFETLIKAFALLTQRRPARLIILGEGEELDRLNACARELGVSYAVDLPGYVLNPYAYLSRASIFVLSSAWEGLGNVIVEALACGCPVVSTDCPSGPREILDGGRFGKLVPVRDAKAIADAIEETLDNPPLRDSLRKRAQDFNVADSVSAYETEMLIKTRTLMP